jgi:hypothetical protein
MSNMPETGGYQPTQESNTFIKNDIGATHFIEGRGTPEEPYESQGGTHLRDSMENAYHTAMYNQDGNTSVFFTHQGQVIKVNGDMEAIVVTKEGETANHALQELVEKTVADLRQSGHRPLTDQERIDFQSQLEKQVERNKRDRQGIRGIVNDIIDKLRY